MPINYTPLIDGDIFDAARTSTVFDEVRDGVNELALNDVERRALDAPHLPSLWVDFVVNAHTHGPDSQVAGEQYFNGLPDVSPTGPVNYQAFSGVAPAPYGATGATNAGWRIIAFDASTSLANAAESTCGGFLSTAGIQRLKLKGWAEVRLRGASFFDGQDPESNPERRSILIALGFEDGAGARHIIERSVRWNSGFAVRFGSISTTTLLTPTDIAMGDGQVAATFCVLAARKRLEFGSNHVDSGGPYIFRYGHTAVPLRAGIV